MNGLSLRISNNGNNNSKKIESNIPLFNLSYLACQRFGSKINNLNDFVEAQNVTKQLEFIRNAAKILDGGHLDNSESVIQLFVAIFLEAPLKHPLKNTCARILSNRKDQHQNIEVTLSKEILKAITSITSLNDFGPVNILSNTINSCFENFAPGVAGVQGSLDHILVFIKAALMAFIEKLRADGIKMSPTEKLELYNFIHNACRVFISILKKCEVAPSDTLDEVFWREFSSLCIFLQNHFELPMDTKGLASIVLVIISRLRFGLDSWIILLQNVYGIQNDSNHPLNIEYNMLDSETAKVYVCSAIVNIVDIEDIATKSISGVPALIFLCSKLVELSKELSVDTTIILGVARTMLSLSRLLYKVQDVNVAIKAAADLLNFVWSHLEYYVDSVRHLATQILTNIVKLSVTLEKKGNTQLSIEVFSSVMLLPNDRHSKYKGLATLGSEYGCVYLLDKIPNLVEELLSAIDNVIVPANVSYAFDTLMTEYSKESSMENLFSTWITPILNAVIACKSQDDSSSSPTLTVLEDILTKAVNLNSSLVPLMISAILEQNTLTGNQMSEGQLKCILVCLHVARKMGVFDSKVISQPPPNSDKWKNVIQYHLLIYSMIHHKSEIRLLAFSLVVNPHKTTETFTEEELDLILTFLHYNINVQSPATRQRIIAISKKLMKRWKNSFDVILRNIGIFQTKIKVLLDADTTDKDKIKPFLIKFTETVYQLVVLRNAYIKFVEKLWTFCLGNIFPGANFSRRSISLQILVLCQEMKSPHISWKWTLDNENSLLNYLDDSYECNKQLVVELLQHCPLKSFQYNNRESIVHILEDTLKLASSVKPTDCMTSAYKLELLTKFPQELLLVLHNLTEERSDIPYEVQYLMIKVLMKNLANEMDVARDNILMAAAKGPMYGLLFCIKHLLNNVDFGIIASNTKWSSVICQLIQVSFEVNEIVGPIVNNSSPEGHLPMDFNAGTTQDEGTGVQLDCGMKVTAQMVLLCAWRSVKEVSLLLGEISNRAVILENEVGTIDEKTVLEIGEHFTNLLSETKHRGAFEQAYLGFSKLCSRLWKCSSESLHNLPRLWLDDLISAIASGDTKNSKLCSTRRSAGVPYMVQALVTTELQVSGNPQCFQKCMATLLNLARFDKASTSQTDASVEVRTHCLNILRALYRHTALGEHVNSYVADGLMTAIAGFNGATWAERNSSTLLFSSLMTRIFGVQRTKNSDDLGIRNRMTGRIFFQRYPKVYDFIHEEFSGVEEEIENIGKDLLKPSLYPILLLLARLYPSSVEGVDSNLQLAKYIPYLLTCAKSCVLKTRRLAAKAMVPLISHDKYVPHCLELLKLLGDKEIKTNYCHGILLQLIELLEVVPDNLVFSQCSTELVGLLQNSSWILSNLSGNKPCFVTAESYVRMAFLLKVCSYKIVTKQPTYFLDLEKSLLNPEQVVNTQRIHFGKEGFYIQCLHLKIGLLLSLDKASDIAAVLITALGSPMYEIVQTALTYLLCFYESTNLGEIGEFELPQSDECFSNLFQPHETIDILNALSSSTEYEERLYDLLKKDVYVQCQQKALAVLSYNLGSLTRILALFAPSAKSAKAKLKILLKLADSENESINYIYLRFISNYIECMREKSHSIYLCFSEESIKLLSHALFECSSSDKSNEKRMECANLFVNHWEFLDWERNQADRIRVQGIILQWSALLQLADDENDEIKYKITTLANILIKKQISKYNDTLPYEEFLCNESKAKEIIVEVAAMWMSQESIDHAIITLIIMALGCNTSISEQLIDEECRVFEKGEVNIYQEEIALSTVCTEQINKILNSGQYCTEVWKSCTFKQRTVHILNGIKSHMEHWPSKDPSGDLSAFLIMLENSLKEEDGLQVENVFQSKISYHKVTNLVYNLGLIQSPPYLL